MDIEKKVLQYLTKIEKENKKINAFLQVNPHALEEAKAIDKKKKKGKLAGYVIGVKSNINVKGLVASCASKTLENYTSTFDATVIEKIKAEDGIIIGMLNCDEFACGSSGETSAFGPAQNPKAPGYVPGGSSSGSAAALAADFCDLTLGSDTGGSIRLPASHCGVVGVKPSYGLVSRYGLIDLSMSLDQIGPLAHNVQDAALLLEVIKGKDEKDATSKESPTIKLSSQKKVKIGVLKTKNVDKNIQALFDKKVQQLKKAGWSITDIEIKHSDLAVQTYYPIVYAEFFSATRRMDGRRYGEKIEDSCGPEILRRLLGGTEITKAEFAGQYYKKALQVKKIIQQEFNEAFEKLDAIICPTTPVLPWKIGEGAKMKPEEMYATDALAIPANLAGICAVSVPIGAVKGLPLGLQIMCQRFEESKMLSLAKEIEATNESISL